MARCCGIRSLHPLPSPQLTNVTRNVINFASVLKDFYVSLESNDALHFSIATYLNAEAIVSLDDGSCAADHFTIYAPT